MVLAIPGDSQRSTIPVKSSLVNWDLEFQSYIGDIKRVLDVLANHSTEFSNADAPKQPAELAPPHTTGHSESVVGRNILSEGVLNLADLETLRSKWQSELVGDGKQESFVTSVQMPSPILFEKIKGNYHDGERINVKTFLENFDRMKLQLNELTGQNSLLHRDKSFLTGRNEYLEKSNRDLTSQMKMAVEQVSTLQQSREQLLQNSHLIHEKDRTHYLQSFQTALKNMDAEKMKDLGRAVRHQVKAYESQIGELQKSLARQTEEKVVMQNETTKLQKRLNGAELAVAAGVTGQTQIQTDLQIALLGRSHDLGQAKSRLQTALENVQRLQAHCNHLEEKNKIILQEHETQTLAHAEQVRTLQTLLNSKISQLDAYENLSESDVRNLQLSFAIDRRLVEKDNIVEQLLTKLSQLESALAEKATKPDVLEDRHIKEMAVIILQQERSLVRLTADVQELTVKLRTEKETLEKVKKTRDELYEVVSSDPRFRV